MQQTEKKQWQGHNELKSRFLDGPTKRQSRIVDYSSSAGSALWRLELEQQDGAY